MNPSSFKSTLKVSSSSEETLSLARQAVSTIQTSISDDAIDREFVFTDRDFDRVRGMILKVAGISLADSKQSMVYSRLARRLRACGMDRFSAYLDSLENNSKSPEWEQFTNALTTNLTSFFREAHHFDILARQLKTLPKREKITLWCSASSTGEEPYTLAITAMEAFQSMRPPVSILASDIDTKVLEIARKGVYRQEQLEKIPKELVKKYFLKGTGENEGLICVRPELKELITFRKINLLEANWQIRGGFDAIFCRNVMIYFEKDVQMQILKRFAPLMQEGGYLYAGHSENFSMAREYFSLKGKTVYVVNPNKCFKGLTAGNLLGKTPSGT